MITESPLLILEELNKDENISFFKIKMTPTYLKDLAEDYYRKVKEPIDLGTIRENLFCSVYKTDKEVLDKIRLVFRNAILFNNPSIIYHKYATDLLKKTNKLGSLFQIEETHNKAMEQKRAKRLKTLRGRTVQEKLSDKVEKLCSKVTSSLNLLDETNTLKLIKTKMAILQKDKRSDQLDILYSTLENSASVLENTRCNNKNTAAFKKLAVIIRNFLDGLVFFIKKNDKELIIGKTDFAKLAQDFLNRKVSLFPLSNKSVVKVYQLKVMSNVENFLSALFVLFLNKTLNVSLEGSFELDVSNVSDFPRFLSSIAVLASKKDLFSGKIDVVVGEFLTFLEESRFYSKILDPANLTDLKEKLGICYLGNKENVLMIFNELLEKQLINKSKKIGFFRVFLLEFVEKVRKKMLTTKLETTKNLKILNKFRSAIIKLNGTEKLLEKLDCLKEKLDLQLNLFCDNKSEYFWYSIEKTIFKNCKNNNFLLQGVILELVKVKKGFDLKILEDYILDKSFLTTNRDMSETSDLKNKSYLSMKKFDFKSEEFLKIKNIDLSYEENTFLFGN